MFHMSLSKRYRVIALIACGIAISAIWLTLWPKEAKSPQQIAGESEQMIETIFQNRFTNGWSILHAGMIKAPFYGRDEWVEYYVVYEGKLDAFRETLTNLEGRQGHMLLITKLAKDNKTTFDWWTPENQPPGHWVSFDTRTNRSLYIWEVFLVENSTNALIYSFLYKN